MSDSTFRKTTEHLRDALTPALEEVSSHPDLVAEQAAASWVLDRAGLRASSRGALMPVTLYLGYWMGRNLRREIPMELAIAELDEIAGASLESLIEAIEAREGEPEIIAEEVVHVTMLKAAMTCLEKLCLPGRAVEVATALVRMTGGALASALPS